MKFGKAVVSITLDVGRFEAAVHDATAALLDFEWRFAWYVSPGDAWWEN